MANVVEPFRTVLYASRHKSIFIFGLARSRTGSTFQNIYKLPAGASTAELYLEHRTLMGVDGITFVNGTLYVNHVIFNKPYRIRWTPPPSRGNPSISGWISP